MQCNPSPDATLSEVKGTNWSDFWLGLAVICGACAGAFAMIRQFWV